MPVRAALAQAVGPGAPAPDPAIARLAETLRIASADDIRPALPRSDYYAETRRNLRWVGAGRQKWLNYSFTNKNRNSLDPDWPISIIFYGHATADKVKEIFGPRRIATRKYAILSDGAGLLWNSDRGVKLSVRFDGPDGPDTDVLHVRIFAPPAGFFEGDGAWGHYVIATTHLDFNPPFDNVCGCSEDAERLALEIAESRGYQVAHHAVELFNTETFRVRHRHYRQSDGYAGLVHIPESYPHTPPGGKTVSHDPVP